MSDIGQIVIGAMIGSLFAQLVLMPAIRAGFAYLLARQRRP